jgi:glutathione reductase (NADPH)
MEATKGKYIAVDDFQQTSAKGVYALGDVCGKIELTPVAIAAGRRLADRLAAVDYCQFAEWQLI